MTRRTDGAVKTAPRPRSGMHVDPRRKLSAPRAAWELWDRAAESADDDTWAEWARGVLTIAAADELGIEPTEALAVLSGRAPQTAAMRAEKAK